MSEALHVVCPHCDTVNRLPAPRLTEGPKCGVCHRALFAGEPVELTAVTWEKHVDRSDIPVVVDFWAPWCGPCKMMAPEFVRAARQLEPRVRLAKLNTDAERSLAARFGIQSIPTLILFVGGREVARQPGAMSAADIAGWVRNRV